MEQTGLRVTPTHTIYDFAADGVKLTVTFFTPALPHDLDALSRPVTYLSLTASSDRPHTVSALIDVDPIIAVNAADEPVTWGRSRAGNLTVLSVGSRDQQYLHRPGDDVRIDWGYFHLAVPDGEDARVASSREAMDQFVSSGSVPTSDDMDMPRMPRAGRRASGR